MTPASPKHDPWDLASRWCNGEVSTPDAALLSSTLRADSKFRTWFVGYMSLHAELLWRYHAQREIAGLSLSKPDAAAPARGKSRPTITLDDLPALEKDDLLDQPVQSNTGPSFASQPLRLPAKEPLIAGRDRSARAASVLDLFRGVAKKGTTPRLVAILGACLIVFLGQHFLRKAFRSVAEPAFAYLTAEHECRWDQTNAEISAGAGNGPVHLRSGVAKFEFADGARILVEGPSRFQVQSAGKIYLNQGKLLAQVPSGAVGFTVETPNAKIVDRGTEFVVEAADGGQTKVAVTKGAVDLIAASGATLRVTAGNAMAVSGRGTAKPTAESTPFKAPWVDRAERLPESLPRTAEEVTAFQVTPDGLAGNQESFRGGLGLDFDVRRPIRVTSLGVFDHLGDGVDSQTDLTVQLWSRENHGTLGNPADDTGTRVLTKMVFSAGDEGTLMFGHRFKPLAQTIDLAPGSYSIVAYGCSENNPFVNLTLPKAPVSRVDTSDGSIGVVGSRFQDRISPDKFPSLPARNPVSFAAGSFRYHPLEADSTK